MDRIGMHYIEVPKRGDPPCPCGRLMVRLNVIQELLARLDYASSGIHIRVGADIWHCPPCKRWFVDSDDLEGEAKA